MCSLVDKHIPGTYCALFVGPAAVHVLQVTGL